MARNDDPISPAIRRLISQQAHSQCPFCGERDVALHEVHHIVPRAQGGSNEPDNLILVCRNCHVRVANGTIPESVVREKKRAFGATIYRMPGAPEPSPPAPVVSIGRDVNNSLVAGRDLHVHGDAKPKGKMAHPPGSIGADLSRKNYVQYLVRRYDEFRQVGVNSYGQNGTHQYGAIHKNIAGKFKAQTYFIPVERFDDLVRYLHGRIDKTIQAKRNRSRGHRAYSSFEDYTREQGSR